MKTKLTKAFGLLFFSLFALSNSNLSLAETGASEAREVKCCKATCFPRKVSSKEGAQLIFQNCSKYTYLFFNLYTAALYLEPKCPTALSANCSRRLELRYDRSFTVDNFVEGAEAILKKQNALQSPLLKQQIDEFHKFYLPVEEGDTYALQYHPEIGTTLILNEKPLGTIPGHGFAAAYFGIWLGPNSLNDEARDDLLSSEVP